MFDSKFYTVMIVLSFLLMVAAVVFQVIDMQELGVFVELSGK